MDPRLEAFSRRVAAAREGYTLPLRAHRLAEELAASALALLFPHFAASRSGALRDVEAELDRLRHQLQEFLSALGLTETGATELTAAFLAGLPDLAEALTLDAESTYEADPAAHSLDEVLLAYPGFLAVASHRIAHDLAGRGVQLLPRLIAEFAHRETGIDIHPGARIGRALAIDHGTGIVIGETAVIGDRVRIYQGVTLGALSVRKALAQQKRHPTLEDDVTIYANATILGGDTIIGAGSVIGGNVWLTHSVKPGSVVTHGAAVERQRESGEFPLEFNI